MCRQVTQVLFVTIRTPLLPTKTYKTLVLFAPNIVPYWLPELLQQWNTLNQTPPLMFWDYL